MADLATPFGRATMALTLLALDPSGLAGLVLRARAGPVRSAFCAMFGAIALPQVRLHPHLTDEALFGGLDLSATLASGRIVLDQGLLAAPSALILTMAERAPLHLAARLAMTLDVGRGHCLIALDEGAAADEIMPAALSGRLGFHVDLTEVALGDLTDFPPDPDEMMQARAVLPQVTADDQAIRQIAGLCLQWGIDSLRAPLFALRAARAHAALQGRLLVGQDDIAVACALTLAHRATQMPDPEDAPPDQTDQPDTADQTQTETPILPDDLLLDAVRALLPDNLLDQIAARQALRGKGSGSGAAKKGNRRGRPLPARAGRLGQGARLDLVATLRAAAPWQTIRAQGQPPSKLPRAGLHIRPADIRLRRFEDKSDRLLIFAVDASGSAALSRLAEAKGAVELLLAQAYARRDHVGLIGFRGTGAEVLLPPTRSLVQTKRRLASLPGGGGTPLAAGLQTALAQADLARRRGLSPTIALLTDGRANVALDGTPGRVRAAEDAQRLARLLRSSPVDVIVIDIGNRPEPSLKALAATMAATYLPLPRADARRLSAALTTVLDD